MHVTLTEYNRLTPEEQRKVTSIDASIVDDEVYIRQPDPLTWDYVKANEEYGR